MPAKKKIFKDKKGTVLLLALLMMASAVVAGVGMGHIIISQLRQSILTDNAISAYYAAESAIESSLYQIRALEKDLGALPTTGTLDNNAEWEIEWSNTRPDVTVSIAEHQTYQLDLFNPDDLSEAPGIEALRFAWTGPGWLEIAYVSWFPAPTLDTAVWPEQEYQVVVPAIDPASSPIIRNEFQSNQAYRVRLRAMYGDIKNLNITGWSADGAPPGSQIPLPSHITLQAFGKFGLARQAVAASIPRFNQLSGIFDFVLFSEQPITKE